MKKFEELKRHTSSNFMLTRRVKPSSKQLEVSADFARAGTVAEGHFMHPSGVDNAKTPFAGGRRRAS